MTEIKIEGMTCQHCVKAVSEALSQVAGVSSVAAVDLETGVARVEGSPDSEALVTAVKNAGYQAKVLA